MNVRPTRPYTMSREQYATRYWGPGDDTRWKRLWQLYGVTDRTYYKLLKIQDGGCAICGQPEPVEQLLHVDHDHATGHVRGLLCLDCNLRVVGADRDPDKLRRAADYLEERQGPLSSWLEQELNKKEGRVK